MIFSKVQNVCPHFASADAVQLVTQHMCHLCGREAEQHLHLAACSLVNDYLLHGDLFFILVKMAGDGGLNALSLLPENVLPQWQQKIAYAENIYSSISNNICGRMDFLHEVQFFAGIGPAHFPAVFEMLTCQHSKKGPHSWGRP